MSKVTHSALLSYSLTFDIPSPSIWGTVISEKTRPGQNKTWLLPPKLYRRRFKIKSLTHSGVYSDPEPVSFLLLLLFTFEPFVGRRYRSCSWQSSHVMSRSYRQCGKLKVCPYFGVIIPSYRFNPSPAPLSISGVQTTLKNREINWFWREKRFFFPCFDCFSGPIRQITSYSIN